MENTADELDIQDVHPQVEDAPAAEPDEQGTDTPAADPKGEPNEDPKPAPTDKVQQQDPKDHWIPKWRLDEVLEQNRQLKAMTQQAKPQAIPQAQRDGGEKEPTQDQYATYEEYIEARADYRAARTVDAKLQALQQQATQAQQYKEVQDRVEKAEVDWNADLYAATQKNPTLIQKLANAPSLRPDLQLLLKESKARVAVAEHLADNPALVIQMNQMPPDRALRALVETEFKLTAVTGGPQKKPSSQAPSLDPVGGSNIPVKKSPYAQDASMEEYIFGTAKLPGRK